MCTPVLPMSHRHLRPTPTPRPPVLVSLSVRPYGRLAGLGDNGRVVEQLLAALGGPDFRQQASQFDRLADDASDVLLAVVAGEHPAQGGGPHSDPRGIYGALHEARALAATRWPQRFPATVAATPTLRRNAMV